ncbi:MAG: hypothetical protein C0448_01500 [Sphingobacteriaceae bacterium]|nr:hypothetical protein [Sphingobacteriaceae bacterium]
MIKYLYISITLLISFVSIQAQNLSVSFSKNEQACVLGEASIQIISGAQPIQILWSNGSTSNKIEQLEDGNYSVTITDDLNQDTTINFTINVITCEPVVETHFTPNGDEFNDTWNISRVEYFPNFELFVYNRWGQLVHSQASEFIPWDGRSLTIPTPDATYYYILFLDRSNKKEFMKGDVSIVR